MGRFLVHVLIVAVALYVTAWILPGVAADSIPALLVAAVVLGIVNAILRPILVVLTLPVTIVTLGLFYLVVNGLCFWLMSKIVPGFSVTSFGWAILGALVVGLISSFVGWFAQED
jgi:putative membrane protein